MRVLFASSEVYPLIKTGGLADVSASLPVALASQGVDVRIILPGYREVLAALPDATEVCEFDVFSFNKPIRLLGAKLPNTSVSIFIVETAELFERDGGPYQDKNKQDWPDNAYRFAVFCRAVAMVALGQTCMTWQADVVHCSDWQTGLVAGFLSLQPTRPGTIFTIHNLAYQGVFNYETFKGLMLPDEWFAMDKLEFYGHVSFIKGGIVFSDYVTTVSPHYADEILTPEYGCQLDGLLRMHKEKLVGILNGIDYQEWDSKTDAHLAVNFDAESLEKKKENKTALQKELGLKVSKKMPLIANIGRMVEQKGVDLFLVALKEILQQPVQCVVLGSGEAYFEQAFLALSAEFPEKMRVWIGYNETLAHKLEAAADIFVMPSRYEPCGLNQIYSLRYGTLPVVRRTGGLADTVQDCTPESIENQIATGFVFNAADANELTHAINRAMQFYTEPKIWKQLQKTAMSRNFSWEHSAQQYLSLYQRCRFR